jgi:hypothetical protein
VKVNGTMKIAGGVVTLGAVIGLAFGAYFVMTDAVGGEAKTRQLADQQLQLQNQADDVDFEIYKVSKQMDEIDLRAANGIQFHGDVQRLSQLSRQLDILLRRQDNVLLRIEDTLK